jgi:hypothetical protein
MEIEIIAWNKRKAPSHNVMKLSIKQSRLCSSSNSIKNSGINASANSEKINYMLYVFIKKMSNEIKTLLFQIYVQNSEKNKTSKACKVLM